MCSKQDVKEFKQLNNGAMPNKPVVAPIDPRELTQQEKNLALNVVTVIKQKTDGTIKGQACADGRRQRDILSEYQNVSSPPLT